jgi:VWFA-related protein
MAGQSPLSTVLVLDRSGSMAEAQKMAGAKQAAQAFIAQMRPDDRTAVVAFSDQAELLQPFTNEQAALNKAIGPLRPDGSTALYDALQIGLHQLQEVPGRRALIVLTDGRDLISAADPRPASRATLEQVLAQATAIGVPVTVIGLGAPGAVGSDGIDEAVLGQIAHGTEGSYTHAPSSAELATIYRVLSAGLQREYALTYRSPLVNPIAQRTIRVVVGSQVQAGYQPTVPLSAPPTGLPTALLPLAGLSIAFGSALLWRSRRMRMREQQARRPPAIGPTVALSGSYCIECGQALAGGARFCTACGAPSPVVHGE